MKAFLPGEIAVRLAAGVEVSLVLRDWPTSGLSAVKITARHESTGLEIVRSAGPLVDLGQWSPGVLSVTAESGRVLARSRYVLPRAGSIELLLPTPATPAARVLLRDTSGGGGVDSWTWHDADLPPTSQVRTLASASGEVNLPTGGAGAVCMARRARGGAPTYFSLSRLSPISTASGIATYEVLEDEGAWIQLMAQGEVPAELDVYFRGYQDASGFRFPVFPTGATSSVVDVSGFSVHPLQLVSRCTAGLPTKVRVPANAVMEISGSGDGGHVRVEARSGAPGSSTDVVITMTESATVDVGIDESRGQEKGPVEVSMVRVSSRGRESALADAVISDPSGRARFYGVAVPVTVVVSTKFGASSRKRSISIEKAGVVKVDLSASDEAGARTYAAVVLDAERQPVQGALVGFFTGPSTASWSPTGADGAASFVTAFDVHLVTAWKDGYLSESKAPTPGSGLSLMLVREGSLVVRVSTESVGGLRRFRVLRAGVVVNDMLADVPRATEIAFGQLQAGEHEVKLETSDGRVLGTRQVSIEAGKSASVQL